MAAEWLAHRKTRKALLTHTAWNAIKAEAAKAGWSIADACTKAMERGWTAFNADWLAHATPRNRANGETAYQRSARERMEQWAPSIAAKKPGAGGATFVQEVTDAVPKRQLTTCSPACSQSMAATLWGAMKARTSAPSKALGATPWRVSATTWKALPGHSKPAIRASAERHRVSRNLCRKAPTTDTPCMEAPKADPWCACDGELAKLHTIVEPTRKPVYVDDRAWARRLIDRHVSGAYRSTPAALKMAYGALGVEYPPK